MSGRRKELLPVFLQKNKETYCSIKNYPYICSTNRIKTKNYEKIDYHFSVV